MLWVNGLCLALFAGLNEQWCNENKVLLQWQGQVGSWEQLWARLTVNQYGWNRHNIILCWEIRFRVSSRWDSAFIFLTANQFTPLWGKSSPVARLPVGRFFYIDFLVLEIFCNSTIFRWSESLWYYQVVACEFGLNVKLKESSWLQRQCLKCKTDRFESIPE